MEAAGMIEAPALAALPGIRHGFFTRTGGVSTGIYQSLNGGIGSRDSAAHVAENRARMAAALGVRPPSLLTERCRDRKSTRLNSSHVRISYAVFCLKKKKKKNTQNKKKQKATNKKPNA